MGGLVLFGLLAAAGVAVIIFGWRLIRPHTGAISNAISVGVRRHGNVFGFVVAIAALVAVVAWSAEILALFPRSWEISTSTGYDPRLKGNCDALADSFERGRCEANEKGRGL